MVYPIRSFQGLLSVFLAVFVTTSTTYGCTSPSPPNPTTSAGTCGASSTTASGSTTSSSSSSPNKIFGVPEAKLATAAAAAAAIRGGGELQEPESHKNVQEIITKAGINNQLVVIDFTATWCGPCQMIAPVFKQLAEDHDDVVFLKVDVDELHETAAQYQVSAMPTFILIKEGRVVERVMGANAERLTQSIHHHM